MFDLPFPGSDLMNVRRVFLTVVGLLGAICDCRRFLGVGKREERVCKSQAMSALPPKADIPPKSTMCEIATAK